MTIECNHTDIGRISLNIYLYVYIEMMKWVFYGTNISAVIVSSVTLIFFFLSWWRTSRSPTVFTTEICYQCVFCTHARIRIWAKRACNIREQNVCALTTSIVSHNSRNNDVCTVQVNKEHCQMHHTSWLIHIFRLSSNLIRTHIFIVISNACTMGLYSHSPQILVLYTNIQIHA